MLNSLLPRVVELSRAVRLFFCGDLKISGCGDFLLVEIARIVGSDPWIRFAV